MSPTENLTDILKRHQSEFLPLLAPEWCNKKMLELDLSPDNPDTKGIDFSDPVTFQNWTNQQLKKHNAEIAIGRYLEERVVYTHGQYGDRCVHVGLDIGLPAKTALYAPLDATVEGYADYNQPGDYGPTLLLKHELDGVVFYSLYGHLSRDSYDLYQEGKHFKAGDLIGYIGDTHENGGWPTHVHVQIMKNKVGSGSTYQGVVSIAVKPLEKDSHYDPNKLIGSGSNYQGVVSIAVMPLEKDNHFDPKLLLTSTFKSMR